MSIFGKIKDAILGHKAAAQTPSADASSSNPVDLGQSAQQTTPTTQQAQPAQNVDVGQVLDTMARDQNKTDLNYKTSIVDLMKLLGLDSSLENRKQLATELGYTGATDGSAEMNMWLSKAVMKELAANGGNVSANLM